MCPQDKFVMLTAAGLAGVLIISYYIYFDKKRKERGCRLRQLKLKLQRQQGKSIPINEVLKRMSTQEEIERYFLQEMQVAEALTDTGEYKLSVEHYMNALRVCSHSDKLLEVLEKSLSPQVFDMMLHENIEEVAHKQTIYPNNYSYGPNRTLNDYKKVWAEDQADKLK